MSFIEPEPSQYRDDGERLDAIERRLSDIADTLRVLLATVRQQQSPESAQRFAGMMLKGFLETPISPATGTGTKSGSWSPQIDTAVVMAMPRDGGDASNDGNAGHAPPFSG